MEEIMSRQPLTEDANTAALSLYGGSAREAERYLDLLKRVLTRAGFPVHYESLSARLNSVRRRRLLSSVQKVLRKYGMALAALPNGDGIGSNETDPATAGETMVGLPRLDNIHDCIRSVLKHGVPGDLIETGVWRGGATIFMRAALEAYGDKTRSVWVADSFQGVPPPNADLYPADEGSPFWTVDYLAVPLEEVKRNFARYDLLDDRVRFLPGWFKDTLPRAPIRELAVLRVDGDIYESTMDALANLYPKLSVGGYVIVDDYGAIEACKAAVEDYRARNHIREPIRFVEDWQMSCIYWRRERA